MKLTRLHINQVGQIINETILNVERKGFDRSNINYKNIKFIFILLHYTHKSKHKIVLLH